GTRRRIGTGASMVLLLVALSVGACATTGGSGGGASSDTLTGEQLIEARHTDLLEAVQNLRPTWIRGRGANSINSSSEVIVFLNGAPYGTVSDLRSIPLDAVVDVRFLSASEAGARYGTLAGSSGLLLVRTRG
ncbi:MAG: hypothetical protein WEA34_04675, partial [Gemmatimonadota bacterium]